MVIYSGFTMIYPLKIVIFHSYVSLPEGKWIFLMEFKDVYNVYILLQKIWRVHQRTMVNSTSLDWETLAA